jgi:imidazolonepropionase-like amidohydrolase
MIEAVRLRCKEGADFIKIMATGGGTPGTYPCYASYAVPEIAAAVETAHRIEKRVGAHCRGTPGIRNAIEGGIDQIEHASFELPDGSLKFDPRLADQMAEKNIYVTPTIRLYRDLLNAYTRKKEEGPITPLEEERLARMPGSLEEKLKGMGRLLSAGVKCVAGNDAGLPFTRFGRLWQELAAMVEGGMTPIQAVVSATKTAAEAMGLDDEIGSIEVGKQADVIVVDGDPTADITALNKISLVMRDGKVYLP